MRRRLLIAALLAWTPSLAQAAEQILKLVAWNLEHLAAQDHQGCRPRDSSAYAAISRYLERLGADVVAFQEVENRAAARRAFPAADYDIHISNRPPLEFKSCRGNDNRGLMQRAGFAVRKDLGRRLGLQAQRQQDFRALGGPRDTLPWGVHLILAPVSEARAGAARPLHLLAVHLKAGCAYQPLKSDTHPCRTLNRQAWALSAWVAARAGQDFVMLGDFNRQLDQLGDPLWRRLEAGAPPRPYVDLEKALQGRVHPRPQKKKYPYAIDHIVYNQALDATALEQQAFFDLRAKGLSDHLPVVAAFDLSRRE